jgi:hypothetical protein
MEYKGASAVRRYAAILLVILAGCGGAAPELSVGQAAILVDEDGAQEIAFGFHMVPVGSRVVVTGRGQRDGELTVSVQDGRERGAVGSVRRSHLIPAR